jgi:hypothetical protein
MGNRACKVVAETAAPTEADAEQGRRMEAGRAVVMERCAARELCEGIYLMVWIFSWKISMFVILNAQMYLRKLSRDALDMLRKKR